MKSNESRGETPVPLSTSVVGASSTRIEGRLKVTGAAKYTAERHLPGLLYAVCLGATIGAGKIKSIDTALAKALPGVVDIFTYKNRPRMGSPANNMMLGGLRAETALPLQDASIRYFGQCVAFIVANTLEAAQHAATCVEVVYEKDIQAPLIIEDAEESRYKPTQSNGEPLQMSRGNFEKAFQAAHATIDEVYETPSEHPCAMEPHASIAHWHPEDGSMTVYDTSQWVIGTRNIVAQTLEVAPEKVRIVASYVGGMFGSKAAVGAHLMLCALASRELDAPIKVVLTRQEVLTNVGYRSRTIQRFELGAERSGKLTAMRHTTRTQTALEDEFAEPCGLTSRLLYNVDNYQNIHEMVRVSTATPAWMRAPGEATCQFAQEVALDELAEKLGIDPLEMRVINHTEKNMHSGQPWSAKYLLECYRRGAELFGWSRRNPKAGETREGRMLVGMGVATATYPGMIMGATVRVKLTSEAGRVGAVVATAGIDVGTGMYTMMAMATAHELGLAVDHVTPLLGDSSLPPCALAGGSNLTASVAPAIKEACGKIKTSLLEFAQSGPLKGLKLHQVEFREGRIHSLERPDVCMSVLDALEAGDKTDLEETGKTTMVMGSKGGKAFQSFGAQFAEVHVDPILRTIRVARMTGVFNCGKIINAQAAYSQLYGGMTFGIGMALLEELSYDRLAGRAMNTDLAGYAVPVNADVPDLQVEFVGEPDYDFNPVGCRGIGEIGNTGASAAIANAVYHATGRRVRKLPISTVDLL